MGQLAVNLITVYRGKIAPNKEYCNSSYIIQRLFKLQEYYAKMRVQSYLTSLNFRINDGKIGL